MYANFTDRALRTMQYANEEAKGLGHEFIGTEHILLGMLREGSGVAANVLKNLNFDADRVRAEVQRIILRRSGEIERERLSQTPRAKKVIEYAIEESRNLNHNYIGTEHLLLGLLREEEGVAAQVLLNMGMKLAAVRTEELMLMGQDPRDDPLQSLRGGVVPAELIAKAANFMNDLLRVFTEMKKDASTNRDFDWKYQLKGIAEALEKLAQFVRRSEKT